MTKRELWEEIKRRDPVLASLLTEAKEMGVTLDKIEFNVPNTNTRPLPSSNKN